jgi:hypothetical protein
MQSRETARWIVTVQHVLRIRLQHAPVFVLGIPSAQGGSQPESCVLLEPGLLLLRFQFGDGFHQVGEFAMLLRNHQVMGVNAAAIKTFQLQAAKDQRRVLADLLLPLGGPLFCFGIWRSRVRGWEQAEAEIASRAGCLQRQ